MHHTRVRTHGDPGSAASTVQSRQLPCSVEGCDRQREGAGLCNMHYKRMRRSGAPGFVISLKQPRDGVHAVNGYRYIRHGGKQVFEHRVVMEKVLGRPLRNNENVHHLDGDKLNNDPSNLELWVKTQPAGQRVSDRVKAAIGLLKSYPEFASKEGFRLVALESQEATDLLEEKIFDQFLGAMTLESMRSE